MHLLGAINRFNVINGKSLETNDYDETWDRCKNEMLSVSEIVILVEMNEIWMDVTEIIGFRNEISN